MEIATLIVFILLVVVLVIPVKIHFQLVNKTVSVKMDWAGLKLSDFSSNKSTTPKKEVNKQKTKKSEKVTKKRKEKKKKSAQVTLETLIDLLPEITSILTYLFIRIRKLFQVPNYNKIKWRWAIGGDDPAFIGFLFGLYQALRQLLPDGEVVMDFVNQVNHFECAFRLDVRIGQLILWLGSSAVTFPYLKVWKVYKMVKS